MDITKVIGVIAVYGALIIASNVLAMALMILSITIKQKTSKMTKVEFEEYFKGLDEKTILKFLFMVYMVALAIAALLGYKLFQTFDLGNPIVLAVGLVIIGFIKTVYKIIKNRMELIEALKKFGESK